MKYLLVLVIFNLFGFGEVFGFPQSNSIGDYGVGSNNVGGGASRMKNLVKGPADLGIYFINSPGVACGGLKTSQCSTSCSALGYPVYWCYPKLCYCHFGNSPNEEEIPIPE